MLPLKNREANPQIQCKFQAPSSPYSPREVNLAIVLVLIIVVLILVLVLLETTCPREDLLAKLGGGRDGGFGRDVLRPAADFRFDIAAWLGGG